MNQLITSKMFLNDDNDFKLNVSLYFNHFWNAMTNLYRSFFIKIYRKHGFYVFRNDSYIWFVYIMDMLTWGSVSKEIKYPPPTRVEGFLSKDVFIVLNWIGLVPILFSFAVFDFTTWFERFLEVNLYQVNHYWERILYHYVRNGILHM